MGEHTWAFWSMTSAAKITSCSNANPGNLENPLTQLETSCLQWPVDSPQLIPASLKGFSVWHLLISTLPKSSTNNIHAILFTLFLISHKKSVCVCGGVIQLRKDDHRMEK